jgi:hypothetical protein
VHGRRDALLAALAALALLAQLAFFPLPLLPFEFVDSWFRHKRADTGSF